jgi:hypothetical protein
VHVVVLRLQRGRVRGCAWLPCAMYSRDTGNERARQCDMHTSVIVSRAWMGLLNRCDAARRQLPFLLPWRLQCNNQAYAARQPSGGGRGGAQRLQGRWESHSRDGVRHAWGSCVMPKERHSAGRVKGLPLWHSGTTTKHLLLKVWLAAYCTSTLRSPNTTRYALLCCPRKPSPGLARSVLQLESLTARPCRYRSHVRHPVVDRASNQL